MQNGLGAFLLADVRLLTAAGCHTLRGQAAGGLRGSMSDLHGPLGSEDHCSSHFTDEETGEHQGGGPWPRTNI